MSIGDVFKTGQKVPSNARYVWDHYTDGTYFPFPKIDELTLILKTGETFPPIHSQNKETWWKMIKLL
jgi:hypothetical protein